MGFGGQAPHISVIDNGNFPAAGHNIIKEVEKYESYLLTYSMDQSPS